MRVPDIHLNPVDFEARQVATREFASYTAKLSDLIRDLYDNISPILYTTTIPDGNLTAVIRTLALYYDGANYTLWINVNGGNGWIELTQIYSLVGNLVLSSTNGVYFGDTTTNGSWRFIRSGDNLVAERRESGNWVEKGKFKP